MADADAPLLPELARSLRSLGRPTDAAAAVAHGVVFTPLLDARARATKGDAGDAVAAFRGAGLAARIESLARAACNEGQVDPARGRARVAAARELLDPLRAELMTLDRLSVDAAGGDESSVGWQRWVGQLKQVFTVADVACDALARVLGEGAASPVVVRGWFRRGSADL